MSLWLASLWWSLPPESAKLDHPRFWRISLKAITIASPARTLAFTVGVHPKTRGAPPRKCCWTACSTLINLRSSKNIKLCFSVNSLQPDPYPGPKTKKYQCILSVATHEKTSDLTRNFLPHPLWWAIDYYNPKKQSAIFNVRQHGSS